LFPFKSAQFTTNDGVELSFAGDEMTKALQYTTSKGYVENKLFFTETSFLQRDFNPIHLKFFGKLLINLVVSEFWLFARLSTVLFIVFQASFE